MRGYIFTIGKKEVIMATRRNKKRSVSRKAKQRRKIILFVVEIVFLLLLLGLIYLWSFFSKVDINTDFSDSQAGINKDLNSQTVDQMQGYTNIALFGLDNRTSGSYDYGNSDTIMIASINNDTHEVKIVSVYRDTYLSVGGGEYNKANSAYNKGGVEQAVKMLNANLDLNITEYACVDWAALIEAIDALGGIQLELTNTEVYYINGYLNEIDRVLGISTPRLYNSGKVNLTGAQATAYARIRYTAGSDFLRTSRQRIVIEAMLNKAKTCDLGELTAMCSAVFDDISTSLTISEILGLAKDITKYSIAETTGFPLDITTRDLANATSSIVPVDLSNNVAKLHAFLFENEKYVPSNTVEAIDKAIIDRTGVTEDTDTIDIGKYNDTAGADGTGFKDKN